MIQQQKNELVVIASEPNELVEGQLALIDRVKEKVREAELELASAEAVVKACNESNITARAAIRLRNRAVSRKLFLSKVKEALECGYVIMPNFPGRTIAIRVKDDDYPKGQRSESRWNDTNLNAQQGKVLPIGEGRYVNPLPLSRTNIIHPELGDGDKEKRYVRWSTGFSSELGLPVEFMKPHVIQRTGKTATRKIFDELAITGDSAWQQGDPMVLGRIIDRTNQRTLTFLVAWFIDSKDI